MEFLKKRLAWLSRGRGVAGRWWTHYGSKQETLNYTFSHELGSEQREQASKRMSAGERESEASKVKRAV